jgi:hypothetical protein
MHRRLVTASAIAVVLGAAFLTGSGARSSAAAVRGAKEIPAGLAAAIHARFGAGSIRSGWAARVAEGPGFGYSVSLSADGTTALVGTPDAGPYSTVFKICCHWRNGEAYVFHVSSAGAWSSTDTPTATLTPNNPATFGAGGDVALSADGTTAFVLAPSDGGRGVIYIFHVAAEDAWVSSSKPKATLTSNYIYLGPLAVSSDGTTLVANAPYADEYGGTAVVFHVSSESAWATTSTQTATLTNEAGGGGVAISGDGKTVLLSDYANYESGGGASLFHVDAENAWTDSSTPNAILSDDSITAENTWFGGALALSNDGTVALVSSSVGTVDVFHVDSAADWASTSSPTAVLTNAGGLADDYFGADVKVSSDGTTALVDAPGLAKRGGAYIFHVSAEGAWATTSAPTATLTDSNAEATGTLGQAEALSGDGTTVLLGEPDVNWETGEANVFHGESASSWLTSSTPTAKLTNSALPKPHCVVPHLVGKTLFRAKETLSYTNCLLGKVKKVHSTKKNKGRVFWQSRAPKRHIPPGSKITIKVGK